MRRITGALLVLAAAAAMAGCTSGEPKRAAPPAGPVPGAGCPNGVASGHAIRFGTNGATNLGGVVFGTGKTGVVLAHQSDGDQIGRASCRERVEVQEVDRRSQK